MALNDIQLNSALLKEMYANSLVEVMETPDKKTLPKAATPAREKTGSACPQRESGRTFL